MMMLVLCLNALFFLFMGLFFKTDELLEWTPASQVWTYDMSKGSPE